MANKIVHFLAVHHPWTNVYGIARSLLALGTFITFLTNDMSVLFLENYALKEGFCDTLHISLFCLIKNPLTSQVMAMIILMLVIIGWRPRLTALLHGWVMYSFINSATLLDGGDHIGLILSLLLLPIALTDSRIWHWATFSPPLRKNTLYGIRNMVALSGWWMIKIQVAIIYLNAATAKIAVPEWLNGTALYYWIRNPFFGSPEALNFVLEPIILNDVSLFVITWGVIVFEFVLFAGLFMDRRHKKYMLMLGLLFHFSIWIIHGLASFFFTMAAALTVYFVPIYYTINFGVVVTLKNSIYALFRRFGRNHRKAIFPKPLNR